MKTAKAALLVSLSLVLAFGLMMVGGCTSSSSDNGGGGTPGTKALVSIAVTPGDTTLSNSSKTEQFTATGTYDDQSSAPITTGVAWTSSDATKATIGATTGLATTVAAASYGAVTITATSGGKTGTAKLTVTPTYTGTVYMASELGGHIGIFDVSIDPTSATPITVTNGSGNGAIKQLSGSPGSAPNHIFHDVRLDAAANRVYYSTIIPDDAFTSQTLTRAHIGYYDVTGNTLVDAKVDVDAGASATIMAALLAPTDMVIGLPLVYCASALETVSGTNYYTTLSMTVPAYIDTFKRSDIVNGASLVTSGTRTRFYVSDFRPNDLSAASAGTDHSLFAHGIASTPAGDKLYVMVNGITVTDVVTDGSVSTYVSPNSPTGHGLNVTAHPVGTFIGYLLKMSDVVAGTVSPSSILASHSITGMGEFTTSAPTVGFRSSFTPDGTKILQSGKDRFFVLDATTLEPISTSTGTTLGDQSIGKKSTTGTAGSVENHDALSTPDSKYAILTIRYADSSTNSFQTGGLQLYDLTTMKPVGVVTPTCSGCHAGFGTLTTVDHHLCGIDGKLTAN
jgi:hypothetical protein